MLLANSTTVEAGDYIFGEQLPRQDFGVLYGREQISRVLTECLVGRIEVFSTTRGHG